MLSYGVFFGLMYVNVHMTKGRTMDKNLAIITWAHGVNDKAFLRSSLNSDIDMLEADIVMGRLVDDEKIEVPIMAHPPNVVSNLALSEFVSIVDEFNNENNVKKGIKLDFKCIKAFDLAIRNEEISAIITKANYPIWLNADILEGPLAPPLTKPVNAEQFLKGGKLFPRSVLSLGWTTGFNRTNKASYTDCNVEEMLRTVTSNDIRQPVTFAVRAGLVAESQSQINMLLRNNNHTLTVWSSVSDEGFDVGKLNLVLDEIGFKRIYVDVPHQLKRQLSLLTVTNS